MSPDSSPGRRLSWIPFALLLVAFCYEIVAIRGLTQGHFVYSLDDAYIHLALAERIAQGHYGINLGEVSAPASSIVWPFLLAPFSRASFFEYVPLVFNLFAAAGTVCFCLGILRYTLAELPGPLRSAAAVFLAVVLIPATNVIGLAFTGMEHSLQACLCAGIVLGVIRVTRGEPTPLWLVVLLAAAPTVRYECLAVSVPAIVVLLACRRLRAASIALVALAVPILAFSLYLKSHGLDWLPTSVVAKAPLGGALSLRVAAAQLHYNLGLRQGQVLAVLMLALVLLALLRHAAPLVERLFAALGAAAILAHLVAAHIGWWDRYEIYMILTGELLVIYEARELLQWARRGVPAVLTLVLLAALALFAGRPYLTNLSHTPLASANIYEQQYQMRRFAVDFYRGPVAVHDLGFVSFRNPSYVLDLWGLASPEALASRFAGRDSSWMDELVRRHGAGLVMIYDDGSAPRSWVRLARLHLGSEWTVTGNDVVTFFASNPAEAGALAALLAEFAPSLPPGVRLELNP
jgi:hypothetical protein